MKLNTNSNSYIIIYSAILVVVVAFLLAFVYQALKPMQDANVALDVKKQILYSLNIRDLDGAEAEAKYAEVVKKEGKKWTDRRYYLNARSTARISMLQVSRAWVFGVASVAILPLTKMPRSMVPTSTMRARRPAWVLKSRILRPGRRSSSAKRSTTIRTMSCSL